MGKNMNGGNHKHTKRVVTGQQRLRTSTCEDEVYAIIIKMLGNGMCHVKCNDDVTRLCIIRGGFRGKNKSANIAKLSSWVLVGIRTWETTTDDKLPKCDLLEIYSESDKEHLNQTTTNFMVLKREQNIVTNTTSEMDDIHIGEDIDINIDSI
jgi:initiation factor 1A